MLTNVHDRAIALFPLMQVCLWAVRTGIMTPAPFFSPFGGVLCILRFTWNQNVNEFPLLV